MRSGEMKALGDRLARAQRLLGLSESDMARRMGARLHHYQLMARGAMTPELFQLAALCESAPLSLDWLLLGRGGPVVRLRIKLLRRIAGGCVPFWAQGAMTFALFIVGLIAFLLWTDG